MEASSSSPQWTTIATFNRLADARELVKWLKAEDLQARVYDERILQRLWFWVHPKAGIHVQVDKSMCEAAERVFQRLDTLAKRAVRCPQCNSSRVQYPAVTRKNMLPAIMDHLFSMFGQTPAAYYCESCHLTWNRPHRDSPEFLKTPSPTLPS